MFTESDARALFERNRDDLQLQADVFDGQNRFVMVSRVTLSGSVYYSIRPTWDDSSEHGDFRVPKHYAEREEVFWATHLPSLISDVWLSEKGVTLETFLASTGIGEPQFHHWRQVLRRYQAYMLPKWRGSSTILGRKCAAGPRAMQHWSGWKIDGITSKNIDDSVRFRRV